MLKKEIKELLTRLFPICRSLTGAGVRETLSIINQYIPLTMYEIESKTKVFDWTVPKEWNIRDAYIANVKGKRIISFINNNLHIMGYSKPINKVISLLELQDHLYSIREQPDAIPYVTSYYNEDWGFCLSDNNRKELKDNFYHVYIDSELKNGSMTYADCVIPGESSEEVFLTSYICHPSMANNELSGPIVLSFIARMLKAMKNRYTYRIAFTPETIGALVYFNQIKDIHNIIVGFNLSCIGDNKEFSYVESRYGNTYADKVISSLVSNKYSYLDRGSNERQYCSPGIDLPLVTICRSKFGRFPEYHTSFDNLDFVSEVNLMESFNFIKNIIFIIEENGYFKTKFCGEPQLGKRNMYSNVSKKGSALFIKDLMDFLTYADGKNDLIDISNILGLSINRIIEIKRLLFKKGLIV